MRLKKEQIALIAYQMAKNLKKVGAIFKVGEAKILEKIQAVIQKNVDEEAAIEDQVKKLMDQSRAQIGSGSIDPQKAYQMIKKQIAQEKNFIL